MIQDLLRDARMFIPDFCAFQYIYMSFQNKFAIFFLAFGLLLISTISIPD